MTATNGFIDISVARIEVIQCIQSPANDVRLIKGKRTFVRVFVEPSQIPEDFSLSAMLSCSLANAEIPCLEPLLIRVDQNSPDRRLWSSSLNFEIPSDFWDSAGLDAVSVESVSFTVRSVHAEHQNVRLRTEDAERSSRIFKFDPSPSLHLKLVGLRVFHPETDTTHEPNSKELDLVANTIECMFPVAGRNIHVSQVWVDASADFELLDRGHTNAYRNDEKIEHQLSRLMCQLLAIRNEDIVAGQDPRTLYLGVLPDPLDQYGGIALEAPDRAAPHTVAICSVEGSGELAAHELAHSLGCEHPGVPDIFKHGRPLGQYGHLHDDEGEILNSQGYISVNTDSQELLVGLDLRRRLSTPAILDGGKYFELMTYRYPKWICKANYDHLYERLIEIDQTSFTAVEPSWSTIASYHVEDNTGSIEHVLKSRYWCPHPADAGPPENTFNPSKQVLLSWNSASSNQPGPNSVRFYPHGDKTGLSQKFGLKMHNFTDLVSPPGAQNSAPAPVDNVSLDVNGKVASEYSGKNLIGTPNPFDAIVAAIRASIDNPPQTHPHMHATVQKTVIHRKSRAEVEAKIGRDPDHIADLKMDDEPRRLDYGVRVSWSASTAQPYFQFYWPDTGARVSTTVQCQFRGDPGKSPLWQTIAVTNARHQRIWIDRRFYGLKGPGDHGGPREPDLNLLNRFGLGLAVRVFVTIGFERICVFRSGVSDATEPQFLDELRNEEHRRTSVSTRGCFINGLLLSVGQQTEHWLVVNESPDWRLWVERLAEEHLLHR